MEKAFLVFAKELRVMYRDRRLVLGVAITSLIVMPVLMGLIGNLDRLTGAGDAPVHVLIPSDDEMLFGLLSDREDLRLHLDRGTAESAANGHLTFVREGSTYRIFADGTDTRLTAAAQMVRELLEVERARLFDVRLLSHGLSAAELDPFTVEIVDTANDQDRSRLMLGILVPYLVIILLVSNAIRAVYVAVGEKEKNTLASILVSNVPRRSIVLGKTLAIVVFAVFASFLLVSGLTLFANLGFTIVRTAGEIEFALTPVQIVQITTNVSALALFIASIIMLLGTFARTQREAGVYTSPLIFVAIFLAVFSFSSSDFSTPMYAVPILGNSLAMKDSLLGVLSPLNLAVTIATNVLLFAVFLEGSVALYKRESVLFRP
jgi:sodium transport system permease protein